jgi:3-hydroxypropanoate dehydrogenase
MNANDTLDQLFFAARTHRYWQARVVDRALLARAWDTARMAPTSANCSPMRVTFVESAAAREKLKPALIESNVRQTMSAPVTAIIAYDTEFYEHLPRLYPPADARSWFTGPENAAAARETAFRNGSLQGAYFMLALRAQGLDCGPMSGFDQGKVNAAFFPDGRWKVNFLCNIGYGEPARLHPRSPRLEFAEISRFE